MSAPGDTAQKSVAERLGDVRASIRPDLEISRHIFGGEPSYLLVDSVTGQTHRFTAGDYQLVAAIDSRLMLKEVYAGLLKRNVLTEANEEDFYNFVVHLQTLGLLLLPIPNGKSLHERMQKRADAMKRGKALKWMSIKLPLMRPDAWLGLVLPFFGPLFSKFAFVLWLICSAFCGVIIWRHREDFTSPLGTILAMSNVPVLWTLLVGLKAFHELGHAVACRRFGGRVPEVGLLFMMGTPCAYVDASSSWSFPNRWHRIAVALAGMYFESIAGMVALMIWLSTDQGVLHSASHYAIVLSTVVTIGFNANPLMKYDGYYVLSDLLRMPNLQRDAQKASTALFKRIAFGVTLPNGPWRAREYLLALFGMKCMTYRVAVMFGIATLLAVLIPVVGPIFSAIFLLPTLFGFARNTFMYLGHSKEIAQSRWRAISVSAAIASIFLVVGGLLPVPGGEKTTGIAMRRDERAVRTAVDGFLVNHLVRDGTEVETGTKLFNFENHELEVQRAELQSRVQSLALEMSSKAAINVQLAAITQTQLATARSELEQVEHQLRQLQIAAPQTGRLTSTQGKLQTGRFYRRGEPLATICDGPWMIKTFITEEACVDVTPEVGAEVLVRMTARPGDVLVGRIAKVQHAGSRQIVDAALTQAGGGDIAVDQTQNAAHNFFEIHVELDPDQSKYLRRGMTGIIQFNRNHATVFQFAARKALQFIDQMREAS